MSVLLRFLFPMWKLPISILCLLIFARFPELSSGMLHGCAADRFLFSGEKDLIPFDLISEWKPFCSIVCFSLLFDDPFPWIPVHYAVYTF